MIVLDTSGLLSALDRSQPQHRLARAALAAEIPPLVLSPFVLAELDYLVAERAGVDLEIAMLREVAGACELARFEREELTAAIAVVAQYRELGVGLADASLVVLAAKHGTRRILTLDERHFRALRPLDGGSFTLLPADA